VLATSIALCLLLVWTRGKEREFFLDAAAVWFFNMVLLSTVGRPIERYLMPLVPIMFWALTGVIMIVWKAILLPRRAVSAPGGTPTLPENHPTPAL
jgi:hypothetical protein